MKQQPDGSVTQRFCIATLQKCSIKDKVIPTMIDHGLIDWIITLLRKSLVSKIHVFCLDFSSAMLANIIHSSHTLDFLKQSKDIAKKVVLWDFNMMHVWGIWELAVELLVEWRYSDWCYLFLITVRQKDHLKRTR